MRSILPETWEIPNQIRDRFGDSAGRQRAMTADGHLLLVFHEPPGPDDRHRKARIMWRNPKGDWACDVDGNTTHLLKRHVGSFASLAERLEIQLAEAACASDYFILLQAIAPLYRTSRNLHSTLQSARDMIPEDRDIIVARDAAGDVERAFELLQADAKNGMDFTAAQKAELQSQRSYEMAQSAHRLNILAALFFPVTAISSIFGMNFPSGLETVHGTWMFWGIIGSGFLSGVLLTQVIARKPSPLELSETEKSKIPAGKSGKKLKQTKQRLQKAPL